ncbi:MAG: TonB-dependent receptor [Bacteroidetes bacterium]|nr:TonB-dependent receptor [Bacteroidota bacterium]
MKKIYFLFLVLPSFCMAQDDSLLVQKGINLKEVIVSESNANATQVISKIDLQLRPTNSAQDLLRLVPGLFIAQHAGGGKAEQIFLRGFDCDHGTDFSVNIDGMPVNMVSHAHGQGYADFHFVIPETVDKLKVFKGPYNTAYGDFATSGAGEFSTKNNIGKSMLKLEGGQFDTYRGLLMLDLLQGKHLFTKYNENFYVAGEYNYTNSYFESKQHFNRYNIFTKYSAQLNARNYFSFSGSTFSSHWDASGQIPNRAVNDGAITRFGSIDNTEGGKTGRTNFNASLTTTLKNGAVIKNQAYYSYYDFSLYSNFTFFLHDSINGDQINQTESGRNIYGYKFTLEKNNLVGGKNFKTLMGAGTRIDDGQSSLRHSVKRVILDTFSIGHLNQQNAYAFLDESINLTSKLTLNMGVRFDYFYFKYHNYRSDSLSGMKQVPKVSPKLNLYYNLSDDVQLYAHAGYGFHSNDARSVVVKSSQNNLPTALGYELGSTFKLGKSIIVNAAAWGIDLQSELVYVGDEAIVEITGATRRLGADLSVRWQLNNNIFIDGDLNYNHGRYLALPSGSNYIPLAPGLTSTGGISYLKSKGFNGSLRYRYMNSRPANEDNSTVALGYFLMDAVLNYTTPKFVIGLSAENILNTRWNQAQFDTESRLKNETQSVTELHYTPGTPFYLKGSITFLF